MMSLTIIAAATTFALASPALAEGGFIYPPAVKVVAAAPATGGGALIQGIIGKIFRTKPTEPSPFDGAPFDTSAPAPAAAEAAVPLPSASSPPPASPSIATPPTRTATAVVVPLPHLRPTKTVRVVTADRPDPVIGAKGKLPPVNVTYETTASITPEPDERPAPTKPPEPPPVATAPAAAPAPMPVQPAEVADSSQGDDLLGDVTTYFAPVSHDMDPDAPAPSIMEQPAPVVGPRVFPRNADLTTPAKPYEMVRTLQGLQDEIAQGSTQAIATQRALRAEIDQAFAAADPSVWQDRRNANAAVTYVLSGGVPTILTRLATLDPKPAIDMRLVTGVLAYVEGKEAEAATDLVDINPLDLPASMGAQMALAQSAIAVRTDPEKAMRLLSIARLLAPGTLVEEAAIRRQLFVANQLKADDMVESLARQYLDRFRHSVYAGNFRERFAAAISRMEIDSEEKFARVDDMLASVEPEARGQLYLTVALASAIKSRFVGARLAAERAVALSSAGSTEESRSRLYDAAALAADPKGFDAAAGDYAIVKRELLRPSDQALYDMVGMTLAGIRSGTDRAAMPEAALLPPEDPNAKPSPLATRATDALKTVDDLLLVAAQ
jgi:chemotaxis protein MotC